MRVTNPASSLESWVQTQEMQVFLFYPATNIMELLNINGFINDILNNIASQIWVHLVLSKAI
jgi:hypothetical protein